CRRDVRSSHDCDHSSLDYDLDRDLTAGDVAVRVAVAAVGAVAVTPNRDSAVVAGGLAANAVRVPATGGSAPVVAAASGLRVRGIAGPAVVAVARYVAVAAAGAVVPNAAAVPGCSAVAAGVAVPSAVAVPGCSAVVVIVVRYDGSVVLPVVVRVQPGFPAVAPRHDPAVPGHWRHHLLPK